MRNRLAGLVLTSLMVLATSTALALPAQAQPSSNCVLKITRFTFQPKQVQPGDRAKLFLRAVNCTGKTLNVSEVQYGEQIPPCPTVDPIGGPVQLGPHARYAPRPLRFVAPDCDGVEVMVASFSDQSGVLAQRTATLHISP